MKFKRLLVVVAVAPVLLLGGCVVASPYGGYGGGGYGYDGGYYGPAYAPAPVVVQPSLYFGYGGGYGGRGHGHWR